MLKEVVLMMLTPCNVVYKLIIRPLIRFVQPDWFYAVTLMELPLMWAITGNFATAFELFMVLQMTFSAFFSKLACLGHVTNYDRVEASNRVLDYAEHQVYASSEIPTPGYKGLLSYVIYAGFNYHAIHHLFPTIDNYNLPKASAIL
jgi:fatty acid desaturase